LTEEQWRPLLAELHGWGVVDGHHLRKSFEFGDFAAPLELLNRVAQLAETSGHHPDLHLSWGKLTIEIWTHKVDGLTRSDFVLAAKCDALD
jgi:4a-hydroxytetrahydrobiopterin dehydratase